MSNKKSLCPFSFNNPGGAGFVYCRGENCALWVESKNCCCIKFIACMMSPLHDILNRVLERIEETEEKTKEIK